MLARLVCGVALLMLCSGSVIGQAKYDESTSTALLNFGSGLNGAVSTLLYHNDTWYVGGEFTTADDLLVNHIARWVGNEWKPLQSGLNGPVNALAVSNNQLYVGGDFTEVGSQTVNHIVRWDGFAWQTLGAGVNGEVYTIAVHNGNVYIGGEFTVSGGTVVNHVAQWTGSQWAPLGEGFNAPVRSLISNGNELVAAGSFTLSGAAPVSRVARWNGSDWAAIGSGLDGTIHALTVHEGQLVAAGAFDDAVSRWNGTSWSALGTGIDGEVFTIASDAGDLVIGGSFTSETEPTIQNVANFEGGQWVSPGAANEEVRAVAIRNEVIVLGGLFSELDGEPYQYLGRLALEQPDVPSLVFPLSNATEVTTSPFFQWHLVSNAFAFRLQVSPDATFESIEHDVVVLDENQIQLLLANGLTTYYYRVRAVNNLGESDWSDAVSFRTRLAYPEAVSPASDADGLGATVVFNWNTVPQAQSYWLQLSNAANFENTLIADESGLSQTTFTVNGLSDNNIYYWRLKAERVGSESDWSPVKSFTVNLPPVAPLLISPEDGLVNGDTLSVAFQWGPVLSAVDFQIQVSGDQAFSALEFDEITSSTSISVPRLKSDTNYFWRVRSRNIGGNSAWSAVRTFRTIISPPSQVLLSTPLNNQSGVQISPNMVWNSANRASRYRIQVSTTQSFATFVVNSEVNNTTFQPRDLIPNRTYYWRVRASNSGGDGTWSPVFSFVTINASPTTPPILSLPGNDAIDLTTPVQLVWQPTSGASAYRVQLSLSADFATRLVDTTGVLSTFYLLQNLLTSERYYWRISSINSAGESAWSEVRTFRTQVVTPGVPGLSLPPNDLTNAKTPLLLDWEPVQGATSYSVSVATDASFENIVANSEGQAATEFLVTALLPQTRYYWRVRARNTAGFGNWSTIWNFTTAVQVPDQVVLVAPTSQSINVSIPVLLRWNPATRSDGYRVQISNVPDLNASVLADINVTNTFYSLTSLNKGQTYFWRVAAFNSGGQGSWSPVRSFTTVPEPPLSPILISPADNLDYIPQPVIMRWQSNSFVERYHIQLSLSVDFETQLVIDDPNLTGTTLDLTGTAPLPFNTIHYWRVKAYNSSGESAWSPVRMFRTLPELPTPTRIINPADGAEMVFMPLALQWEPAARAQGYDVQVSETNRFDSELVVDAQNYNDVTLILNNLKPEQPYWVRVASRNVSGLSAWSDTTQFTTAPKVPEPPVLVSPANNATGARRSQTFVWRTRPDADRYQIQISAVGDFSSVLVTSEARPDTTYALFLGDFNQEYFWRVRALNVSGPGVWSNPNQLRTLAYANQVVVQKSIPFANTRQSSYRLAAIAGDANLPIVFTFEDYGKQGADWNAYAETGSNAEGPSNTVEVSRNSSGFNLRAGRGFWILAKRDWVVNQTLPAVPLTNQDTYRIPLNPGWNIIGNPYDRSVPWSTVQQLNGITDPIHAFEGLWVQSSTLAVNTGYYFFNRSSRTELEIPYPAQSGTGAVADVAKKLSSTDDQLFSLGLTRNGKPLGSAAIHLRDDAAQGFDAHDHVAPPGQFSDASVIIYNTDIHPQIAGWSTLSKPLDTELVKERLSVNVSESAEYTLRLEGLLEDFDSYLFDAKNGRTLRFDSGGAIEIYLLKGTHTFEWVIGSKSQTEAHAESQLPQQFALYDAYPNPFNPTTTIRFALPDQSDVKVFVYDVTGRRVAVLADRVIAAGYHQVVWDASRLASGVYIVELRAAGFRATSKVALVK